MRKDSRGSKWADEKQVEWGARANLVKDDGKWKFKYYQVYLVSCYFCTSRWEKDELISNRTLLLCKMLSESVIEPTCQVDR